MPRLLKDQVRELLKYWEKRADNLSAYSARGSEDDKDKEELARSILFLYRD